MIGNRKHTSTFVVAYLLYYMATLLKRASINMVRGVVKNGHKKKTCLMMTQIESCA